MGPYILPAVVLVLGIVALVDLIRSLTQREK